MGDKTSYKLLERIDGVEHLGDTPGYSLHRAKQGVASREVLFKVITGDNDTAWTRRDAEAGVIGSINHPLVPALLGAGEARIRGKNQPFLVLEWKPGKPLEQVIGTSRRLGAVRTWRIGCQLLSCLTALHEAGLVMGELDPRKVRLHRLPGLGELTILGCFGTGYLRDDDGRWVGQEALVASDWTAPELGRGGPAQPAADVYSVGAILYRCLTGRAPSRDQRERRVGHGRFGKLLARSLRESPDQRFSSAREFLDSLMQIRAEDLLVFQVQEVDDATVTDLQALDDDSEGPALVPDQGDYALDPMMAMAATGSWTLSSARPNIWVLADDPGTDDPSVRSAMQAVSGTAEVTFLDEVARTRAREDLLAGTIAPPWVLVFGDMHVLLEDELLRLLRDHGELSRLLVSTHLNAELIQTTVNYCGLDQSLLASQPKSEFTTAIEAMVERTRHIHRYYDALRSSMQSATNTGKFSSEQIYQDISVEEGKEDSN